MREITRYDESCTQNYQYLSYVYNNCYMQNQNFTAQLCFTKKRSFMLPIYLCHLEETRAFYHSMI